MAITLEWTDERVAQLTQLWDEGHSTSEIGRRLGITKNSVVGKARRLDLAMRRARARCSPSGTTRLTMPSASARWASIVSSPVRMMSFAAFGPTTQGRSMVTIPAPNFSSGSPNTASVVQIDRSQASAISKAPAMHGPWIAAIVGFGQSQKRSVVE